ncbi:NTF2 fold immunity protein [Pandoraea sp.]|uniref:NTF2 fold immunity protein n=1 Tax=Pandoraea sp. TaxID=1883445 RepID=UPI0035ADB222
MTPVARLREFVADMLEWETTFDVQRRAQQRERPKDAVFREKMIQGNKAKLLKIFKEHLSKSALATEAKARLDTMGTGRPPVFAQQVLEDTEIRSGKKVYVETLNEKDITPRRRYALVIEDDEPKIDAVYAWRDSIGKWEKQHSI